MPYFTFSTEFGIITPIPSTTNRSTPKKHIIYCVFCALEHELVHAYDAPT